MERFGEYSRETETDPDIIRRGFYDSPLERFECIEFKRLGPTQIDHLDRAFIRAESGNRYMVRHSRSRRGQLVISNERDGLSASGEHPFVLPGSNTIARVGQPLLYTAILDENTKDGVLCVSSNVIRIEVRKGLEAAVISAMEGASGTINARDLAASIADEIRVAKRHGEPDR